jgi:hypothetical protein
MHPRLLAAPVTAQMLAERELRSRAIERARALAVPSQGFKEVALRRHTGREQPPTPRHER